MTVFSGSVVYRNRTAHGTQVIEVVIGLGPHPYIRCSVQWVESGELRISPMSLPLDEIKEFCDDASRRCTLETLGIQ